MTIGFPDYNIKSINTFEGGTKMSHQTLAKTALIGWNSWDCFGAAVNEKELRENADYMAKNLKDYVGNTCLRYSVV